MPSVLAWEESSLAETVQSLLNPGFPRGTRSAERFVDRVLHRGRPELRSGGRQRHIVTDILGFLLVVMVAAASVQYRDVGSDIAAIAHRLFPRLKHIFTDGGYAGKLVERTKRYFKMTIEIVSKPERQRGFSALPRRWVIERTFSWMMRWGMAKSSSFRKRSLARERRFRRTVQVHPRTEAASSWDNPSQ